MALAFSLVLLALLLLPLARSVWLSTELFRIQSARGKLTLKRGRLPPSLFAELSDIAERAQLDGVVIRAVLEGGVPRLILGSRKGSSVEQPMRNVLGRFTLGQLRSGSLRAS